MCLIGSANCGRCCCCIPLGFVGIVSSLLTIIIGVFSTLQFSQTPKTEIGGLSSSALFSITTILAGLSFLCGSGGASFAYFISQFSAIVIIFELIYQWLLWGYGWYKVGHFKMNIQLVFIFTGIWFAAIIFNIISISIFRSTWEIRAQGGSPWRLKNAQQVRLDKIEEVIGV
ncbi:uncharacterized protein CMU_011500 [Cryptosporidium muris RN66]|uniref:Transmembrane protein n=1 Tax=Cryptosporidium muris (strain RN66) TaxID=441375 RepID=B6AJ09_CRYMR|nr:uncharacterized protein CMU_011500 [Cryptosporidium muris RN66]EEA08200.1 hypothetical protein, conserved [Cryptosporidium muris RN66]|eukprot:XP_002142549.1 hypothetical protein [Cryptosporidium muris RN66]